MTELDENEASQNAKGSAGFPTGWTILLVAFAFIAVLGTVGAYLLRLEKNLVESTALHDASQYSDAIREFRTLYTSEVVERARKGGIEVTHDYYLTEGAIPLPATMSILLGNRITEGTGGSVRLYSDFPFPWRETEGSLLDGFEISALDQLRAAPDQPVYSFEEFNGQPALRYATADLMRPSCVECHNSHPDSPKRDWETGDVRGVLEVVRPVHAEAHEASEELRSSVLLVIAAAGLGLAALALFAFQLRRNSMVARGLAEESIRTSRSLQKQIVQREKAELENVALEQQVHYAQKLESLGLLAGGIAHDFNNFLTAILGSASLASRQSSGDSSIQRHLQRVQEGGQRARDLTEQLMVYAGRGSVEKEPVDLGKIVRGIVNILDTSVPPNTVVQYEIPDVVPPVIADRSLMQQVVLNLFTNACEAIGAEEGEVQVEIGVIEVDKEMVESLSYGSNLNAGPHVYLAVSDTGVGMDQNTQTRIFDPFFTTKGPGRGLGLSAILGIVRSHQGALEVDSKEGNGTTFRIILPQAEGDAVFDAETGMPRAVERSSYVVMVVDDNDDVRTTTVELLEVAGWRVKDAEGGKEALEKCHQLEEAPSVVLLDMTMPGMSGEETFHSLRELYPGLPIVLTSGYQETNVFQSLAKLSPAVFVQKPYSLDVLERALKEVLSDSSLSKV